MAGLLTVLSRTVLKLCSLLMIELGSALFASRQWCVLRLHLRAAIANLSVMVLRIPTVLVMILALTLLLGTRVRPMACATCMEAIGC